MNKIKFSASKEYLDQKSCYPEPIKNNIPKWYKELKHNFDNKTVKGCMPFLDTLTISSYKAIRRIPYDRKK